MCNTFHTHDTSTKKSGRNQQNDAALWNRVAVCLPKHNPQLLPGILLRKRGTKNASCAPRQDSEAGAGECILVHTYMQVRVLAGTSTTSTRQNQRGKKKHQLNIQEENNNPIGRISKLVFYTTTKERRAETPSDIYVNGKTPTRSVPGHHVRCARLPLASEKAGSEVHRGVS